MGILGLWMGFREGFPQICADKARRFTRIWFRGIGIARHNNENYVSRTLVA